MFPMKPNVRKNKGAYDRIPSDPAISIHEVHARWSCRWSLLEIDTLIRTMRAFIKQILILAQEKPYDHHLYSTGSPTLAEEQAIATMPGATVPVDLVLPAKPRLGDAAAKGHRREEASLAQPP
jgi:hypothetical protein